jgi:hypothetical protein
MLTLIQSGAKKILGCCDFRAKIIQAKKDVAEVRTKSEQRQMLPVKDSPARAQASRFHEEKQRRFYNTGPILVGTSNNNNNLKT